MTARERWLDRVGSGTGLWYGAAESEAILGEPESLPDTLTKYAEKPDYLVVKYGGDWGGLWGNPSVWGELSPSHNPIKTVPFLFCLPEHWRAYPSIVGGLLADGYPAVVLNIEEQWQGYESVLGQLLGELNPADNLIGIAGYADFSGWPDGGKAFASQVRAHDVIYMPEAYMSNYSQNQKQAFTRIVNGLRLLFGNDYPMVGVYDPMAVNLGLALPNAIGGSGWYRDTFNNDTLSKLTELWHNPPSLEQFVQTTVPVSEQINTALGQALDYANKMRGYWLSYPVLTDDNLRNLLTAIENDIHTARRLNNGE